MKEKKGIFKLIGEKINDFLIRAAQEPSSCCCNMTDKTCCSTETEKETGEQNQADLKDKAQQKE
ncbi:hypothetical protein ACFL96_14740 [Thermoproteota archaeon]